MPIHHGGYSEYFLLVIQKLACSFKEFACTELHTDVGDRQADIGKLASPGPAQFGNT